MFETIYYIYIISSAIITLGGIFCMFFALNYILNPIMSRKHVNTIGLIILAILVGQCLSIRNAKKSYTKITEFKETIPDVTNLKSKEFDVFNRALYFRHSVQNIVVNTYSLTLEQFQQAIVDRAIKVINYEIEYDIDAKSSDELRDILISKFMNSDIREYPKLKRSISTSIAETLFDFLNDNISGWCYVFGGCDIKHYDKEIWINGNENGVIFYLHMHCYSDNIYQGYIIIDGKKKGNLNCKLKLLRLSKGLLSDELNNQWFDDLIAKLNDNIKMIDSYE